MKILLFIHLLFLANLSIAQSSFGEIWYGDWAGTLTIFKPGDQPIQEIPMELKIHPLDTPRGWTWNIIYHTPDTTDDRPYHLLPKDEAQGQYIIDEKNSIILDAYLIGNTLLSRFEAMETLLTIAYTRQEDYIEVLIFSGKNETTPTGGVGEIPNVLNYPVGVLHRALLRRN